MARGERETERERENATHEIFWLKGTQTNIENWHCNVNVNVFSGISKAKVSLPTVRK